MKKIYLFSVACYCLTAAAQTAPDTSGGRYFNPVFSGVTVTANISYGSNTSVFGVAQNLQMDVYEPSGDTVQYRPLIVFAHGGSFLGGTKTDLDIVTLCNRFAGMGYVCASI